MKNYFTDLMTYDEITDWAKGYVLIAIGKGEYEDAMNMVIQVAMAQARLWKEREGRE